MLIESLRRHELDQRMARARFAEKQRLEKAANKNDRLHVVYVMTHVGICGGSKIIFEHANHLTKHGARVSIVSHFPKPDWFPIIADYIQVPFTIELCHGIPLCDVIVATYWDHIQPCVEMGIAPVVYFEQGDAHLFDSGSLRPEIKRFVQTQYELPQFITTVSKRAGNFIQEVYGREAQVFHNALDEDIFNHYAEKYRPQKPYILMVGSENAKFKGISDIVKAHKIVREAGIDIDLAWITQTTPSEHAADADLVFVNPPQEQIGALFRGASLYISGSHYESFCLPGLEAMACGCAVVTTRNDGVKEYAVDGYNAIFAEIENPQDLAQKIIEVLSNNTLLEHLRKNGLETANTYKWSNIIPSLYEYYKEVAQYKPAPRNAREDWTILISDDQFYTEADKEKFYRFIHYTDCDRVRLPVVYSMISGLDVARWEVAAEKKGFGKGTTQDFYMKVVGREPRDIPYQEAYELFRKGQFEASLKSFVSLINNEFNVKQKLVYFRWAILCLIELDQCAKAVELLNDTLKVQTDNADLYYLYLLVHVWMRSPAESIEHLKKIIMLLGEAVSYPEFFANLSQLIEHYDSDPRTSENLPCG